jgi:hypothetical protein
MAFSFDQRAQIRLYLGFSKMFQGSNTILEGALTTIDGLQDGGATETRMINALTALTNIETQIATLQGPMLLGSEVTGEIKVDAARALAVLRMEGTNLINQLCFPLSMSPARAYFYPSPIDETGNIAVHGIGQ